MKHMKRVTSFLLAVLLTLSLCVPALALTPKADKEIVKAGEDVNVTLTIDEAMSRISSMQACVYFDGDVFTYKSFTADKEEQMTIYNTDRTSDDGRTYRTIDYVSNGKGKFAAGDEFAVFTFTAKKDIDVSKQANFSAYITFRGSLKEDNTPLEEDNVTAEKTVSVTVTPASTEPEGYAVAASAENSSITVNDKAQVALKISNKDVKTYNAYYMEVRYDTSILNYEGVKSTDAKVIDNNGTLKIVGYGDNKNCGTDNIVLTFTGKAPGEAKVTVTSAKVDVKGNADAKDAPNAKTTAGTVTIVVGGYQVTLPDGFKGEGTANPDQDYTFTANDTTKKYDFTGSTMGGETVTVTDNNDGTYTVKNVTGPLVITATALVTIEETGNGWEDVSRSGWTQSGDTVKVGTALNMTIDPKEGRTYTVTVNSTELTATVSPDTTQQVYTIPASMVTGNKLTINVTYTETGTDTITIFETGDALGDVTGRITWNEGGGQIDMSTAGAIYTLKLKPAKDKTKDDYVVTINGDTMELKNKRKGEWGVDFVPNEVADDGKITIDVSYKKAPEPTITVDVAKYLDLDGQSIFLITATGEVADGKVLAYDRNPMYWSSKYGESGAYAWLVIADGTKNLDALKAEAKDAIAAVDGAKVEIVYDGDVNQTKSVDINDAQLVWNMYNAEYKADTDFQTVNRLKYLSADMNGDRAVSVLDATAIVDNITK